MQTKMYSASERTRPEPPRTQSDPQRGSIIVLTAGVILLALFLLGTLQVAYTFYMKRALQNAADLAALSGAQALYHPEGNPDCTAAVNTARAILRQNLSNPAIADHAVAQCGAWSADTQVPGGQFVPGGTDLNAMHVHVQHTLPVFVPFMTAQPPLGVDAIATNLVSRPVAAFSVGPRLLSIDNGLLPELLEAVGLNVGHAVILSHGGVADVSISPSGLLQALGVEVPLNATVGDLDQLLDLNASVAQIVEASTMAADDAGLLNVEARQVLNALAANLQTHDVDLRLFTDANGNRGLFSLSSIPTHPSGLDAQVSLTSILDVVLSVAAQNHALELRIAEIPLLTSMLGLDDGKMPVIKVIEPPSIGIGPEGTKAYSANIRAFLPINADTSAVLVPLINVDLPIVLELANGTGTLGPMCHRNTDGKPMAEISVSADLLTACIGNFSGDPDSPHYAFSTAQSCSARMSADPEAFRHTLLSLELPLLFPPPGLNVTSSLQLPIDDGTRPSATSDFEVGQSILLSSEPSLTIKDLFGQLTSQLLDTLAETVILGDEPSRTLTVADRQTIAEGLWNDAAAEIGCAPNPSTIFDQSRAAKCRASILAQVEDDLSTATERTRATSLGEILLETLNGVLNAVRGLVSDIFGLVWNPCTGGLLGGVLDSGNVAGCITEIANSDIVSGSSPVNNASMPNILFPILGTILNLLDSAILQPVLGFLEDSVLNPLLSELGIRIGQVETTLISLDCEPDVRLVH